MLDTLYEKIAMGISVAIGFCFGEWHKTLTILLVLMCMDYATGLIRAWRTKTLSSTIARNGIWDKFLCFIPVILSNLVDGLLGLDGTILTICIMFYIFSEALSICENLVQMGVKLPQQLIDVLMKVSKDNAEVIVKKETNPKDVQVNGIKKK